MEPSSHSSFAYLPAWASRPFKVALEARAANDCQSLPLKQPDWLQLASFEVMVSSYRTGPSVAPILAASRGQLEVHAA